MQITTKNIYRTTQKESSENKFRRAFGWQAWESKWLLDGRRKGRRLSQLSEKRQAVSQTTKENRFKDYKE